MYNLFMIAIIVIIFLYLVKPSETDYQPNQQDIQDLTYIDKNNKSALTYEYKDYKIVYLLTLTTIT